MKLEFESRLNIKNPTPDQILKGIQDLDGKTNSFAILSKNENTYVQVAGDFNEGFVLEYQNGSVDEHFVSSNKKLPGYDVVKIFTAFSQGDVNWFSEYQWDKEEIKSKGGCMSVLVLLFLVVGIPIVLSVI